MERWFPSYHGEQDCLPIAEAADSRTQREDRSRGALLNDPRRPLPQIETTWRKARQRQALPRSGVDAGAQTTKGPVKGEVSLDLLLHGK